MARVLVAEDSVTARRLLVAILSSDPDLEIVGQARNGAEAVELCRLLRPDVMTMDVQMPVMDGVEATRRIMVECPTPVIMVSSLEPDDVKSSMHAFEAGAVAVLAKPAGPGTPRFEQDSHALIATVKQVVEAQREEPAPADSEPVPSPLVSPPQRTRAPTNAGSGIAVLGLVAQIGGPIALRTFFKALPHAVDLPILIVQHIASGITSGFAEWLRESTQRNVKLATHGQPLEAGGVYIAPDDHHLAVEDDHVVLTETPPVDGNRPSGTTLLQSLAVSYGAGAAGAILSGAGTDGVDGLRALRDAGGEVFVQEEASCAIYGAAKLAVKSGIVKKGVPLATLSAHVAKNARRTVK